MPPLYLLPSQSLSHLDRHSCQYLQVHLPPSWNLEGVQFFFEKIWSPPYVGAYYSFKLLVPSHILRHLCLFLALFSGSGQVPQGPPPCCSYLCLFFLVFLCFRSWCWPRMFFVCSHALISFFRPSLYEVVAPCLLSPLYSLLVRLTPSLESYPLPHGILSRCAFCILAFGGLTFHNSNISWYLLINDLS